MLINLASSLILSFNIFSAKQKRDHTKNRSQEEILMAKLNKIVQEDPGACAHLEYDQESKACNFILIQTTLLKKNAVN